jgi:hypothetical protein
MLRYVLPGSDAVSISSLNKDVAMAANASAVAVAAAASAAASSAASAVVATLNNYLARAANASAVAEASAASAVAASAAAAVSASSATASAVPAASATAEVKKEAENSKSLAGKDLFPFLLPCYIIRDFPPGCEFTNVFFISRGHRPIMHSVGFEHFSVLEGAGHPFCSLFPSISVLACMPDLALLLTCSCAPYFWTDARAGLATECSCRNQRINIARETKAIL